MEDDRDYLGLDEWMVAWNYRETNRSGGPSAIEVGPWPDYKGWSLPYSATTGCCLASRHKMSKWQKIAMMFIDYHKVVMDGVDPQKAHDEFCKIREFCLRIPRDMLGAIGEDFWG